MTYLVVKSLHIIFVVAWMASLLIYPRYKIHQLTGEPNGELFTSMQDAAARLKRIIMTPSLILVWVLGLTMVALNPELLSQGWFHAKLALLLGISGVHGWYVAVGRKIDGNDGAVSERTLRMMNEVPFLLMIGVVLLAVIKPF